MSDARTETGSNGSANMVQQVAELQDYDLYRDLAWEGSFEDYLSIVRDRPQVTRNAFQRVYDMVISYGTEEYIDNKKRLVRYNFFRDEIEEGRDAIFGLDIPLMRLMNVLKAAAEGYGPEKRVILLHGPVGSSKSTIVRLLKKGLEAYSRTPDGALYTFEWVNLKDTGLTMTSEDVFPSPMHEEPLRLVPIEWREQAVSKLELGNDQFRVRVEGDLDPASRFIFKELMHRHGGDWGRVMNEHVRVKRLLLSEKDRIGIGTFQPKDEKNQDSTELTGDINYRKIAEYGSDSDPRAFNFDGEFNIANRGIVEFVEVLKLDVAFLYDLLGASQEHKIKPKKFAQTDIDEVIIGHSVAGDTPIPYRFDGLVGWTTLAELENRFGHDASGLEVLAWDFDGGNCVWTRVRSVFKHRFEGAMLTTDQKWGVVETTPNHSIYSREGECFYPMERREILAIRALKEGFETAKLQTIDVCEGVVGFVGHEARVTAGGGRMTRPPKRGWARLDLPRHATELKSVYDVRGDESQLRDLITVLVWYLTEGHVNGRNGGLVISQKDRTELERVRAAYERISSGGGLIDTGAKSDSAWRLFLGAQAVAKLAIHHCGEHSHNKRLPDFLFRLPKPFLEHAFAELMRTDGTTRLTTTLKRNATRDYESNFFEYKTLSPMLAAQVGMLATLLGRDYSVYRQNRGERRPAYRIRFVSGEGKRGGRHKRFQARLHTRQANAEEWVYDIECEGIHNFVCGIGGVVCHNTNEAEYKRLINNEFMEALRDRTIKIDIPYITRLSDEIRIYEKDFNHQQVRGKHIAPHTLEVAAMWAVLSRLEDPKKHNLQLIQKMKLYDGKVLPGYTQDTVKELRKETKREGMEGISPRYVQDKISNALVSDRGEGTINPFMVLNELEKGLKSHSLITNEEDRKKYRELIGEVKREYEEIVKNEVQRAISADEEAINKLAANYIDNIKAYTLKEKVKNRYTGQDEEPDERLMRSIEEKIEIPENRKDDFRREIMNFIGAKAVEGKKFDWQSNDRLRRALEQKLFEDQKDSIKLKTLVSAVVDKETQEKIDIIKSRLMRYFGYNEVSATDVLNYVASIFARGDTGG